MNISSIKNRVDYLYNKVINLNKDKWKLNTLIIIHTGDATDVNNNKKYRLTYKGQELIYDDINDFYKEYNIYPNKDINPQIIEVIDNSYLERAMYL